MTGYAEDHREIMWHATLVNTDLNCLFNLLLHTCTHPTQAPTYLNTE